MQHPYGVRDVERLLRLPRSTIHALVKAGFVTPARGARNSLRFSFQDLIVLRTAQALADAKVPQRRITQSVRELRKHLPASMPLSGLSIGAVADRVVVRDGSARWQADSGQYLLAFEADPASGAVAVIERKAGPTPAEVAQDWFERAAAVEREDPVTAAEGYLEAIAADPTHLDALINLGRLLHVAGKHARAMQVYRKAVELGEIDPVLYYNVGVLYQDMGKPRDAIRAYEAALMADENLADACYNLALLYEEQGRRKDAIRNMSRYRRLTGA